MNLFGRERYLKARNKWSLLEIVLFAILIMLLISTVYNTVAAISRKEKISYSVKRDEMKPGEIGKGDYKFKIVPVADEILQYSIILRKAIEAGVSGQIGYAVTYADGKEITNGILNIGNLKQTGAIDLNVEGCGLKKDTEYGVILYSRIEGTIEISLCENGEPFNKQIFKNVYQKYYYIVLAGIFIFMLVCLAVMVKYRKHDLFFCLFSTLIGIVLIFVSPPCTAPDEFRHFLRAYTISEGVFVCKDYTASEKYYNQTLAECEIPRDLLDLKLISESSGEHWTSETNSRIFLPEYIRLLSKSGVDSDDKVVVPYHGTTGINPIAYLPQIIFILIAKLLHFNAIGVFYMARMGNLLCATWMAYYGIKMAPKYRTLFTILFFAPGLAFLRSSCSTDSILWGTSLLLLAYILNVEAEDGGSYIKPKTYWSIAAMVGIIALIKLPYILLACVLLFCNRDKFFKGGDISSKRIRIRQLMVLASIIGLSCCLYFISSKIMGRYAVQTTQSISRIKNIGYAIRHFAKVFSLIVNTFFGSFIGYLSSGICFPHSGSFLLPYILVFSYFGLCQKEEADSNFNASYFVLVAMGVWVSILGVFYLMGNPEASSITGVQGRYMLPLIPVYGVGLSVKTRTEYYEKRMDGEKYIFYLCIILSVYLFNSYALYWVN